MAGSVVLVSSPWLQSSLVLLVALLAANATHLVRSEDMIAADRPLSGDRKLVSRGGKFALGFFQPEGVAGGSGRWYVGIWYHNMPERTLVWVANRDWPVFDPATSLLTIADSGNLVLQDAFGAGAFMPIVIISEAYNASATAVAVLLDTGNLVLTPPHNASDVLWQSFDDVGDTWLPGMKLRRDKVTGVIQEMTSWTSRGDPAPGPYTLQLDPAGAPQFVMRKNMEEEYYWGTGDWNGWAFAGASAGGAGYSFQFVDNDRESYFTYSLADNRSTLYRFVMDVSGQLKGWLWMEDTKAWNLVYLEPKSRCAVGKLCGAFGVCTDSTPDACTCACARGFGPYAAKWSQGGCQGDYTYPLPWQPAQYARSYTYVCSRNTDLKCKVDSDGLFKANQDRFYRMSGITNTDDGRVATGASSLEDCERACLGDCTCSAYAYNGSCILWHGELQNLQNTYVGPSNGSLYLRLAASEFPGDGKRRTIEIAVGALAIFCLVVAASVLIVRRKKARRRATKVDGLQGGVASFTYRQLQSFTNNFSDKLGSGAFGSVFRGRLPDHTTMIAVKKLEGLRQGDKQFRAEVSTLGTIHHINLVRLLGFCSHSGDRKLIVYEYMPNASLDRHLFRGKLTWRTRYRIAVGVAKGLSYLHDKCRDCIIHCDVKPENILLDAEFTPKVADFGLAKLLRRDFSRVLTTMRGTIGYLAPEWIGGEAITTKADVYSYGMMLFEIVSGKRNAEHWNTESGPEPSTGSDYAATELFFPVLAARRLAEAGDVTGLLDPALGGDADVEEVRRVCKVACRCIQDDVDARPTMTEVVRVLEEMADVEAPPVPRYLEMLAGQWMRATGHDSSS